MLVLAASVACTFNSTAGGGTAGIDETTTTVDAADGAPDLESTAGSATTRSDAADASASSSPESTDGAATTPDDGATSGNTTATSGASTTGGCGPGTMWYPDTDDDGFGDPDGGVVGCEAPGPGHVDMGGDCDDANPDIHPGVDETCDGVDEDCDGGVDEGSPANAQCGGCQFVLASGGGSYFALCPGPLAWTPARDACAAFGPGVDLAKIDAAADQADLLALVGGDAWIGLSDLAETNHWTWVDSTDSIVGGQTVGLNGWGTDQPDGPGVEHCAELDPGFGGWNDVTCDQQQAFLCRHPA